MDIVRRYKNVQLAKNFRGGGTPYKGINPITPSNNPVTIPPHTLIKDGLTVSAVLTEAKTVTPSASQKTYAPSAGKYFSGFTVNGDADLKAENVRKGVNIFGVTGTLVELTPEMFGFTKIDISSITLTSNAKNMIFSFAGLGEKPQVILVFAKDNPSDVMHIGQVVLLARGETPSYAYGTYTVIYKGKNNDTISEFTCNIGSGSDGNVNIVMNSHYFIAGVEYTIVLMA